ncbi:MAG TPA: hypothetical protein VGX26_10260 [Solirubrobacteraceae bacterium]|nr:hypothetical protein [Solirubrobacteraceae bacterium]
MLVLAVALSTLSLSVVPTSAAVPGSVIGEFGSPGSGEGQLNQPSGIAAVVSTIYVVDTGNDRVQLFSPRGSYLSQFGTAGSGNAQFNGPTAVAFDNVCESRHLSQGECEVLDPSAEDVYVADTGNNRIEKFSKEGVYISQFGTAGTGEGQFDHPSGVAVDNEGNVYVADTANNRIEKFNSSGTYVAQFGTAGHDEGQLANPTGLAVDENGHLYVADTGNGRIEKFNTEGSFNSVLDVSGSQAVAVEQETVYVVDRPVGSPTQIDVYNSSGALTYTYYAGSLASVASMTIYRSDPFVADAHNAHVLRFEATQRLPETATEGASGALGTTATIRGSYNTELAEGETGTYRFQYGPTTAYGQTSPMPEGIIGHGGERLWADLTGLKPATTYHYRLVATDPPHGGIAYGADRTFTTVVLAPAVETDPAMVNTTTATITGGVLPQGLDTTYQFEYGFTNSYTMSTPTGDAGSAITPVPVTQSLTGLNPSTTYHYRLVATSDGGTTDGADETFTTSGNSIPLGGASPFGAGVPSLSPTPTISDLSRLKPTPAAAAASSTSSRRPGQPKCKGHHVLERAHGKTHCVTWPHGDRRRR